jgi:hypothetical protein
MEVDFPAAVPELACALDASDAWRMIRRSARDAGINTKIGLPAPLLRQASA